MMYGNHMGAGGWAFSIFGTLLILGLIVAATIWFVSRRPDRGLGQGAGAASAHEILDRRLTSGEITPDQYDQLREKLTSTATSSSGQPPVGAAGTR
jgi:uncharacterized membrane protein